MNRNTTNEPLSASLPLDDASTKHSQRRTTTHSFSFRSHRTKPRTVTSVMSLVPREQLNYKKHAQTHTHAHATRTLSALHAPSPKHTQSEVHTNHTHPIQAKHIQLALSAHAHTHSLTCVLTNTHIHTHSLSLSLSRTLTSLPSHWLALTHSCSHSHSHTPELSLALAARTSCVIRRIAISGRDVIFRNSFSMSDWGVCEVTLKKFLPSLGSMWPTPASRKPVIESYGERERERNAYEKQTMGRRREATHHAPPSQQRCEYERAQE
jgi:hypothetical protein